MQGLEASYHRPIPHTNSQSFSESDRTSVLLNKHANENAVTGLTTGEGSELLDSSAQGWYTITGGSLIAACTIGNGQSFGVYQDHYTRFLLTEMSLPQISWIGSVQLFLMFGLGTLSGNLFDKGYFKSTVIGGGCVFSFSSLMLSLAQPHHYYQFILAQGIGQGLGMGLMLIPAMSAVSQYFRKRRAVPLGLLMTGGGVGGVVHPIIINKFLQKSGLGFAWGTRLVAMIDTILLIVAFSLMKRRFPPSRSDITAANSMNVLKDVHFWVSALGMFFIWWGIFIPYFYIQLFSKLQGIDSTLLIWAIPIMNASSIFGRSLPPLVAEQYGTMKVMILNSVICGGLLWALLVVHDVVAMLVFAILYGFFSGGVFTLVFPSMATYSTNVADRGLRFGITSSFLSVVVLTGSPIAGILLSAPNYIWWPPLTFGSACIMTGATLNTWAFHTFTIRNKT